MARPFTIHKLRGPRAVLRARYMRRVSRQCGGHRGDGYMLTACCGNSGVLSCTDEATAVFCITGPSAVVGWACVGELHERQCKPKLQQLMWLGAQCVGVS